MGSTTAATDTPEGFRVEHDSLGEVLVPLGARWGAQTQRAVQNFPVSGRPIDRSVIRALALIKAEAARVNGGRRDVPAVDRATATAIAEAAEEVAAGAWAAEFPIDVFQTGSGTSTNMNANEVIASIASARLGRPVHPNDQVNASQSSNDVFPSAIHLAVAEGVADALDSALEHLERALRTKARAYRGVVKAGRTHLMDAVPVTLGQEFGGYAAQLAEDRERLASTLPRVGRLPLGGTATGTGLNAPKGFARAVIGRLAERTGLPLTEAPDHFAAQGARDGLAELSGQLRVVAISLTKIANDLRWMASGPNCGLAEIHLPDLQPGSSIMPGKVNPVIPEVVTQVAAQVVGNDAAVAFACSQGAFELNVYLPLMARNLTESIELLSRASRLLADRCVSGIVANEERCREYAEGTASVVTSLNAVLGYDRASALVKQSVAEGRSIRELVLAEGLAPDQVEAALDLLAMTKGGLR